MTTVHMRGEGEMHEIELRAQQAHCAYHHAYPTQWDAEDAAERHYDCRKCRPTYRMGAFRCLANPSHWHVGHQTVVAEA